MSARNGKALTMQKDRNSQKNPHYYMNNVLTPAHMRIFDEYLYIGLNTMTPGCTQTNRKSTFVRVNKIGFINNLSQGVVI